MTTTADDDFFSSDVEFEDNQHFPSICDVAKAEIPLRALDLRNKKELVQKHAFYDIMRTHPLSLFLCLTMITSTKQSSISQAAEKEQENGYYEGYTLRTEIFSEIMGTFMFVQIGSGAECVALFLDRSEGKWMVALFWIVGATLGIYVSATISGGHINPAVSLSFALARPSAFPWRKVVPFWIAQVLGGFLAGLTNIFIFHQAIYNYEQELITGDKSRGRCMVETGPRVKFLGWPRNQPSPACTSAVTMSLKSASAFGNYWR